MRTTTLEGWLFDVDEFGSVIVLWVYDTAGKLHRLQHEFQTPVFVDGERAALIRLAADLARRKLITGVGWQRKREFWSGDELEVMQLNVADAAHLPRLRELAATNTEFTYFNLSLPPAQYYLCLTGLFPLCRLTCTVDRYGYVQEAHALNSPWEMDFALPPLRVMRMRGERMQPLSQHSRLIVGLEQTEQVFAFNDGARMIERLNALVAEYNPDLILSERGDTVLFPALLKTAQQHQLALQFDRDPLRTDRKIETEGRTYFSYGKVIYKGPSYPLLGRWHIDRANSFAFHETDLVGVIELARLSKMPIQRSARRSPGTAMTGMELDQAITRGILVPWQKSEPERFKTALQLLKTDKGGLTFQPPIGAFENVIEIDFASMYPSLMVRHNLSAETVLCACCQNASVPEADYNVCEKRRGLIPLTLEPLIERRRRLKQLMKATTDESLRKVYEARRAAIKWMLVSCFGYLGYLSIGRNTKLSKGKRFTSFAYQQRSLWQDRAGQSQQIQYKLHCSGQYSAIRAKSRSFTVNNVMPLRAALVPMSVSFVIRARPICS